MARRMKADRQAGAGPEAILPLTDFRGDPWGTGNEDAVAFRAGIMSSPVPAGFAQRMRDEGKAFPRVTVTNLDGSPVKREADGTIAGEPLDLTEDESAALPALDQITSDN